MMRSLYSAISGLRNHQTRMDVIGNNIANVNTTGFKQSRVTFQDTLSQTLQGASSASGNQGGTNPMQVGLGMALASIDTIFTDGSFSPTGKSTDLGISGDGFFILSNGQSQMYTRNGAFDFDTLGNFVMPGSGYKVMGWKADANGVIDTTQPTTDIQIPVGKTMPAKASTKITYGGNLLADATIRGTTAQAVTDATTAVTNAGLLVTAAANAITAAGADAAWLAAATAAQTAATTAQTDAVAAQTAANAYAAGTGTAEAALAAANTAANSAAAAVTASQALAAVPTASADPTTTAVTATATALNTAATATVAAVKSASDTSSQTSASIEVYDAQGNAYKVSGTFEKTAANTWNFTPASTITNTNGVLVGNVTGGTATITFNADGTYNTVANTPLVITPPPASPYAGATPTTINLDFASMTQYGGGGSTTATSDVTVDRDGYTKGTLESKTVSSTGVISGRFSNGESQALAQVALASFNNPGGLEKYGESLYVKSNNSGEPRVGTSGTGGRGKFSPGTLEMSNVDLATEFSNMIVTQRGFQANSKVITTTDTMLEELVNLKR
ncbi:MAG: flagellar hook protein FlgE [Pelosinus sp.]|nr:flagellar hook protein FlgE [Pelosinus sp.]